MKYLALIAILMLSFLSANAFSQTPIAKAQKTTYQIGQSVISGSDQCSATAVGPHAILTATHCELPSDVLFIRGIHTDIRIVGRIRDDSDHTIYLLNGVYFANYSQVDLTNAYEQAQSVFMWGNPGDWQGILRKGYIAGKLQDNSLAAAFGQGEPDEILFDFQNYPGDSGAAIFDDSGKIIAVCSNQIWQSHVYSAEYTAKIAMTGAFPFNFKQSDIEKARQFGVPKSEASTKDICEKQHGFLESLQHFCLPKSLTWGK